MLASPDSRSCTDAIYKSSRGGGAPHRPEELHTDDLLVFLGSPTIQVSLRQVLRCV